MKLKHLILMVAILLAAAACNRGPKQYRPVVDPEMLKLSKEQIFERGEESFSKRRWQRSGDDD